MSTVFQRKGTPRSAQRPLRMRGLAFLVCSLLFLSPCMVQGGAATMTEASGRTASATAPSLLPRLPSREALVEAISCTYTPRPTLLLILPSARRVAASAPALVAASAAVEAVTANLSLTELLPSALLTAAYGFEIDNLADAALVDIIAPGEDTRGPVLALYCAAVDSAAGLPGLPLTTAPFFVPRYYTSSTVYKRRWERGRVAEASRMAADAREARAPRLDAEGLRQWVLSEAAVRYVDPITMAMLPALYSVFSVQELTALVSEVTRWGTTGLEGGYGGVRGTRQPAAVIAAYVRLTTQGSEEVMAALNAAAAGTSGAVMVITTEDAELASLFGLTQVNTARVLDTDAMASAPAGSDNTQSFSRLAAALKDAVERHDGHQRPMESDNGTSASDTAPIIDGLDMGPVEAISTATAAGGFVRRVATQITLTTTAAATSEAADASRLSVITPGQQRVLREWRHSVKRFMTASPLRKLTNDTELQWAMRSQSVKLIFFLRESDSVYFSQHRDLATTVAGRVRRQWIPFMAKKESGGGSAGRMFHPSFTLDVYWVDAEAHPALASRLRQSVVPSAVIALPLLSKEDESARAEQVRRDHAAAENQRMDAATAHSSVVPTLNRDGLHGFHTVNQHDLRVVEEALTHDPNVPPSTPERKVDLQPMFPTSADELLRFIAGPHFIQRAQFGMLPVDTAHLMMGSGDDRGCPSSTISDTSTPNQSFLRLDYRYYATSEKETEEPHYIRDLFTGALTLPDDPTSSSTTATGSDRRKATSAAAAARAAKAKTAWQAELRKRRAEKEARVKAKAQRDAGRRQQLHEEIKKELIKNVVEPPTTASQHTASGKATNAGVEDATHVRRPPLPVEPRSEKAALLQRRRKAVADITAWRDETRRMAEERVVLSKGRFALVPGLEAPALPRTRE